MFTPASPSTWKVLAATPGWLFIPAPTSDTLPICSSVCDRAEAELRLERLERLAAASRSSRGTVNDMSASCALADAGSFWMIMSTFTFASASAASTAAGDAGPVRQRR